MKHCLAEFAALIGEQYAMVDRGRRTRRPVRRVPVAVLVGEDAGRRPQGNPADRVRGSGRHAGGRRGHSLAPDGGNRIWQSLTAKSYVEVAVSPARTFTIQNFCNASPNNNRSKNDYN